MSRARARAAFLAAHGFGQARAVALPQDAGFRTYWRLTGGAMPALLMDAPPEREDVAPFLAMGGVLAAAGLSVPRVFAADAALGLVLLEDFGDALFTRVAADQGVLLDAATDALSVLGRLTPGPDRPAWGAAAMTAATEATFLDWWWPAMFGCGAAAETRAEFRAAMGEMLAVLEEVPAGLVHRDYFAGNLFWLPERGGATLRGIERVGIIDFQDAALGCPAYDLVSLVQDARRDVPEAAGERAMGRLLAARPELEAGAFRAAFAACAAQRHLRVAALWVRLERRDGKPGYLCHGPRCWRLLEAALRAEACAPLARFMDRHVPLALRRNPEKAAA
jgi:aminoglycoside/choline kinase family phosphotransferase